ncbi:MAG: flavin-dependent monooxygenase [Alphaproteobacteria bacterium]|nr:flavin-dependent monooxygenase [Alphaproteobacteria bacterium]
MKSAAVSARAEDAVLSPDELVARARAFAPLLRARQADAERRRQVPQESVHEMLAAGLYRVLQPRRFGGLEHGLDTFVRVAGEIAAGCGSTGWVFSTSAQHQWQIGMYPPEAQEDVWGGNRLALAASSYAPTAVAVIAPGGYRVTGRWAFCSGIDVAQWMILGTMISRSAGERPHDHGYILVPKSDFEIDDNWHVLGLRATGSKDAVMKDVFVPAHRMLTVAQALSGAPPGAAVNGGDLFKIPFFAAITICLCSAILGMARGALAAYVGQFRAAADAASRRAPSVLVPSALTERRVGEAASSIDAAEALVLKDCREIMATIAAGRKLTEAHRARNKGNLGFAAKLATRAVDALFEADDGIGLDGNDVLQRFWRDIHAGAQHISVNFDAVGSLHGRIVLGLPGGTAQF